jgi:hypothetical protein
MLQPTQSTSNGRPTARRISASLSIDSGVCLPSLSITIRRHMALSGSTTRIFAHNPSRSMARKNVPSALPTRLRKSGARKGGPGNPNTLPGQPMTRCEWRLSRHRMRRIVSFKGFVLAGLVINDPAFDLDPVSWNFSGKFDGAATHATARSRARWGRTTSASTSAGASRAHGWVLYRRRRDVECDRVRNR